MRGRHIRRYSAQWRRENCRLPDGYDPTVWAERRRKYKKRQPREILTPGIRRLLAQGLYWIPETKPDTEQAMEQPKRTKEEEIRELAGCDPTPDYLKLLREEEEHWYPYMDCPEIIADDDYPEFTLRRGNDYGTWPQINDTWLDLDVVMALWRMCIGTSTESLEARQRYYQLRQILGFCRGEACATNTLKAKSTISYMKWLSKNWKGNQ